MIRITPASNLTRLSLSNGYEVKNQDRAAANMLSFVSPSSLWPPRLISEVSAWNEHVPFAGWVIEAARPRVFVELGTHVGVSYFAFCESVARLELGTLCYAVDTWLGDEHAGFYGEHIYASVKKTNSTYYGAFSRLMRTTFDEAVSEFDDGSVDLLHLDGLHTYEAARHDFETWLPKLSDRAVMLFHDTNERKEDFGVHRLISELRQQYPVFEFTHEHGLGVVCIGKDVPSAIASLVALEDDPPRVTELRGLYEGLGRRLSSEHRESLLKASVSERDATVAKRDAQIAEYTATVAKRDARIAEYTATVAKRDAQIAEYTATVAKRDARIAEYTATVDKRDARIARLDADIARYAERLAVGDRQLNEATAAIATQDARLDALNRSSATQGAELTQLRVKLTERDSELAASRRAAAASKRSYLRLRRRRSVRLALTMSRLFHPVFRLVRRIRKGRGGSSNSPQMTTAIPGTIKAADKKPPAGTQTAGPTPTLVTITGSDRGRVTVIVPIFNAPDELQRCLRALVRNTTGDTCLLLIDDASTDPRIAPILDEYSRFDGISVVTNTTNLGFVGTVNRGFAESTGDVVILNSDVEVTPGWLDRMRLAAASVPTAGTVTPLSDNAGAFSAPVVGEQNAVPPTLTKDQIGRLIAQSSLRRYPHGPTGNGFCMYVRRACLDDIGVFDAEAFPRGYGEENDFCMRAVERGWTNIVDDATYVFHSRSASFGDEKHQLMADGRKVLDRRYPEYGSLVREFLSSPEFTSARNQIAGVFEKATRRAPRPRPRVLFVLHSAGGGTPATTQDLMGGLDLHYEGFILVSNGGLLILRRFDRGKVHEVGRWSLQQRIQVTDTTNPEYRAIVQSVLIEHGIDLVHIRHLIGHTFELPEIAKTLDIPVVLSFHDFYYICPTVHLIDDKDRFCEGVCSPGQGKCPTPTPWLADLPHLKHAWVNEWRHRVTTMFENVSRFITASVSTRDYYLAAFPQLKNQVFDVIEHGRDLEITDTSAAVAPRPGAPIRILLPGNIGPHKGAGFVKELSLLDKERRLEFHVLGKASGDLKGIVTHHGLYDRSDFESKVRAISPSFVGLFSTTAESFSHVLTEAWAAGIPVLASKLGALKERVEASGGGWLIDVEDAAASYQTILDAAANQEEYHVQQTRALAAAIASRSVDEMANDYAEVYGTLRDGRRSFVPAEDDLHGDRLLRVGVFLPGGTVIRDIKPPGHIRVLRRLADPGLVDRISWKLAEVDTFLANDSNDSDIDVALVHRTAIPSDIVDAFVDRCDAEGIGIVFDIDDDLLCNDPKWDELDHYEPFRNSVETLADRASTVIASTRPLASRLASGNRNTVVLENALDRSLWLQPLVSYWTPPDSPPAISKGQGPRLLFAGGMTHKGDLAILKSALDIVRTHHGLSVDMYVIGGVSPADREDWYQVLNIPSGHGYYPRFVPWLRSMANSFDIGLAPLAETAVNEAKSDLRFLEYAALGLPGIYSIGSSFSSVENGVTGILVDNDPEAWANAIVELWSNEDLRERIRANALEQVIAERLIDCQQHEFLASLQTASRQHKPASM